MTKCVVGTVDSCPHACHAVLCCADMSCRLPQLSTISIQLGADSQEGDLDPVLALMQVQATCMQRAFS
jgi:hypothetical protein